MTIRLSRQARTDLEDIRTYTAKEWGDEQWLRYYRLLVTAFERISADPLIGRKRDLFRPGLRSLAAGRHEIFFLPVAAADGAPVIIRIVHQRRNLPALAYYDDLDS